jgi:hypothetical protein
MMDKKAVQSRIRFIVCTDHAHHTRQPRATARKRHDKTSQNTSSGRIPMSGPHAVHPRHPSPRRTRRGRVEDARVRLRRPKRESTTFAPRDDQ